MIAIFPMQYVRITQAWGVNTVTHQYGYPIDNAGKDTGIDNCYAPFDGVIKKIWANGSSVWLESSQPVEWANGTKDYVVFMATHDNSVSDLRVGQTIKQGQVFYQEGTNNAVGNHVHMEFGKGKYTPQGWYQAPNGRWVINNPVKPTDVVYLTDKNIVVETLGLKFKELGMTTAQELAFRREATRSAYNKYLNRGLTVTEYKRFDKQDDVNVINKSVASSTEAFNKYKAAAKKLGISLSDAQIKKYQADYLNMWVGKLINDFDGSDTETYTVLPKGNYKVE